MVSTHNSLDLPQPASPRRRWLVLGAGLATLLAWPSVRATPEDMARAVAAFTGGAGVQKGKVRLEVEPLVENGNTVPVSVTVESPMTPAAHVLALALFNEHNPQPEVIRARFGPGAGRAALSTRIRLATSQRLLALAQLSDGSFWSDEADVIVTLAACIETDTQE
jgi:sulfur-oxidizing protein SoxY